MKRNYKTFIATIALTLFSFLPALAQQDNKTSSNRQTNKTDNKVSSAKAAVNITPTTTPADLAKIAVDVLGGEKFKTTKSLVIKGSVNITLPNSVQTIPGAFVIATSGDKYRLEIQSVQSFTQIYDGQQFYSSFQGVELPPPTKVGLNALQHLGETGYVVEATSDKKKMRGFSLTTPDGYTTRFYLDQKTGRIKLYEIPYDKYTFGSEVDDYKEYEGVLVPVKFYQRLDLSFGTVYAEYKTKEAQVNQAVEDSVFAIPSK
jgi:hypothetical protein